MERQKCIAHILRNIGDVVAGERGRAREFGWKCQELLREGMELWRARQSFAEAVFVEKTDEIKKRVTHHPRDRVLREGDNQKLRNGLGKQDDEGF